MRNTIRILALLLAASLLLSGCALRTVEELYCLPKRSQADNDLQSVIDEAMEDLEYAAPQSGENRLVVQTADLDGDGVEEYLLFARDDSDKPLKILIFCQLASGYVLMDTIEGYGFGFDFVAYQQIDDRPGVEIIVGRLVSEEVVRSVSVYRFSSGFSRHMLSATYSRMAVADLDEDGMSELLLLNQSATETGTGTVTMYAYHEEELQRSAELPVSTPASDYKQIATSRLPDKTLAVYVTCAHNDALVTDIFYSKDGVFTTLAAGLKTQSLNHNVVFPGDMDGDGMLELPRLIPMRTEAEKPQQYLVQWYSVHSDGSQTVKLHTYYNFADNWYLVLEDGLQENLMAERTKNQCTFFIYDPETEQTLQLMTVTALQDADREELSKLPGRIILHSGETVIYVADLGEAAERFGLNKETLTENFHLIRADLNTQED